MENKNLFAKFKDWVNADENLLTLEQLEQQRQNDSHGHGEDHGHEQKENQTPDDQGSGGITLLGDVEAGNSSRSVEADAVIKEKFDVFKMFYSVGSVLFALVLIGILVSVTLQLPSFGVEDKPTINEVFTRYVEDGPSETGATNMVAGMILDYRAFDTLGESFMLFTAVIAVIALLYSPGEKKDKIYGFDQHIHPSILQLASKITAPLVMLFGIYIVFNGHLSPGGGFSGGAIIGAGLSLYASGFGIKRVQTFFNFKTFNILSIVSLGFYAIVKGIVFYTGANGMGFSVPLGKTGSIMSAGLILPLNICVGIVVACTIYGLYSLFLEGDV